MFNGCSLDGKKIIVPLQKDNYVEILDHFDANSVFAKVGDVAFCLAPFIHFCQETSPMPSFASINKTKAASITLKS